MGKSASRRSELCLLLVVHAAFTVCAQSFTYLCKAKLVATISINCVPLCETDMPLPRPCVAENARGTCYKEERDRVERGEG